MITRLDKPPRELMPSEFPDWLVPSEPGLTFDLLDALDGRISSPHTQKAYFYWIDKYLVSIANMPPTEGTARIERMKALPISELTDQADLGRSSVCCFSFALW